MDSETKQVRLYKLAEGYPITQEGKTLYSWPYTIYYAPEYESGPFYVGAGDGRNGSGTFLTAVETLQPQWRQDVQTAGGEWLLPLLERLAKGEEVARSEILEAYKQIHGKPPPIEEWNLR